MKRERGRYGEGSIKRETGRYGEGSMKRERGGYGEGSMKRERGGETKTGESKAHSMCLMCKPGSNYA